MCVRACMRACVRACVCARAFLLFCFVLGEGGGRSAFSFETTDDFYTDTVRTEGQVLLTNFCNLFQILQN